MTRGRSRPCGQVSTPPRWEAPRCEILTATVAEEEQYSNQSMITISRLGSVSKAADGLR